MDDKALKLPYSGWTVKLRERLSWGASNDIRSVFMNAQRIEKDDRVSLDGEEEEKGVTSKTEFSGKLLQLFYEKLLLNIVEEIKDSQDGVQKVSLQTFENMDSEDMEFLVGKCSEVYENAKKKE